MKDYTLSGYAINEKRLQALQKTVEIQTKMLANTMEVEHGEVLSSSLRFKADTYSKGGKEYE